MTPQPMSDAEIAAMLEKHAGGCEWSDDEYESAEALVAKAMAARDAQWQAMLGEPVGEVRNCVWNGMAFTASILTPTKLDLMTPLYAIKETP